MTGEEREVLAHVHEFVRVRDPLVLRHGRERSRQKQATFKDMRSAILGSTNCLWQPEYGTYRLSGGEDLDERPLDVIVFVDRSEMTNELGDVSIQNVLVP